MPIPTPFPVGPVNVYLLEGKPLTLVDAGPLTDEALHALDTGLGQLGYRIADVEQLVITHTHHDHFGLAREVVERSGAILLSFHLNKFPLEHFHTWWQARTAYVAELVIREGAPEEALQEMEIMRGFQVYATSVPEVTPLNDDDAVRMGAGIWRAIHTPGHALGHICLYHEKSQLLLSGDHLLRDITSNPVLETPALGTTQRPRSLVAYKRSLLRIRELEVRKVLPGHGELLYDHRALVDEILNHHEVRERLLLELLKAKDSTAYELGLSLFGRELPGVELFLALSEIVGHLDVLEQEGKAERVERDGRPVWTARN